MLRKREELTDATGDDDVDDDDIDARGTDSEKNRFFFFPWGFVAGTSSVRIFQEKANTMIPEPYQPSPPNKVSLSEPFMS